MMRLHEAYAKLGYKDLGGNSRSPNWSAEKDGGICISLWLAELRGRSKIDTKTDSGDIAVWGANPKNRTRIKHLSTAIQKYAALVDVVFLEGPVGSVESARITPRAKWEVLSVDTSTGHFVAKMLEKDCNNAR